MGTGLIVTFDTYDKGGDEAPAIELRWKGESLGNVRVPIDLVMDPEFVQVLVRVNPGGTCDVVFGNQIIFWGKPLPNWEPLAGARYGWGGATGGLNQTNSLDSIKITTSVSGQQPDAAIAISVSGTDLVITFDGTLQSSTSTAGWSKVNGAVSPLRVPLSTLNSAPRRFWRSVR